MQSLIIKIYSNVVCVETSTQFAATSGYDYGIWWYSGRGIYTKEVTIPADYINDNIKPVLNLGEVAYFAELWISGNTNYSLSKGIS